VARTGSIPDTRETFPPPPSTRSVEDRLTWTEGALRVLRTHPGRLAQLEESLGEEGNAAKGRPATGLHLALERTATEMRAEIATVLRAVEGVASGLATDRADRARQELELRTRTVTMDELKAPARKDLATARAALIGVLVTLIVGAVAARLVIGWRTPEPAPVTAPR